MQQRNMSWKHVNNKVGLSASSVRGLAVRAVTIPRCAVHDRAEGQPCPKCPLPRRRSKTAPACYALSVLQIAPMYVLPALQDYGCIQVKRDLVTAPINTFPQKPFDTVGHYQVRGVCLLLVQQQRPAGRCSVV